ncbi:unnamed protein product [marine sediment metagenome]|uniref:Transcriptional coactivator p15 (PC4) C-terminal domain-containing protein n=1 Tax=marine sediment metagenome TaxID=412755 RepID=X1JFT0_9ZZZZ
MGTMIYRFYGLYITRIALPDRRGPGYEINWGDGFVSLTLAQFKEMVATLNKHLKEAEVL